MQSLNNPVVCKYGKDESLMYGAFPPEFRFAADSIPTEMDGRTVTLNDIGSGGCFLAGTSQDLSKRVCTVHLCVRVRGPQIIPPLVILRSDAPSEDRTDAPFITSKNCTFKGERGPEKSFYNTNVEIKWDPKAWFSQDVAKGWAEGFVEKTEHLLVDHDRELYVGPPYIGLQQDGLAAQNMEHIRFDFWLNNIYILRTPPTCTDVCSLIDDEIGRFFKQNLSTMLWDDIIEKPDLRYFLNEKLKESDKRILMVDYASKAWTKTKQNSALIQKCAKRMGFFNCRCGCENDKVNVGRIVDYQVEAFGSEKYKALTNVEAKSACLANSAKIHSLKDARKKQRNIARIAKNRKKWKQRNRIGNTTN